MTTEKKAGLAGGITVVGVIALLSIWPKLVPVLEWLAPILRMDGVQNVALAWLAAAFTLPLPWVLPAWTKPIWTKTFAAALAAVVAVTTAMVLAWPVTRTEVVFALFMAGMGSITINMVVVEVFLHLKPCAKPGSLQP